MGSIHRAASILAVCTLLAACQTAALYPAPSAAHVAGVQVTKTTSNGSASLAADVRHGVVSRAAGLPRTGQPKCLRIRIDDFHLKDPAMALIVGDSNRLKGTLTVIDATSGATDASVPVSAMNSYLINGIIGAAQATSQDPAQVERELVSTFGTKVIEKLYGSETARLAGSARPTLAASMPLPAAATTGAAAPASPCAEDQSGG